jgi:hypothetical protein
MVTVVARLSVFQRRPGILVSSKRSHLCLPAKIERQTTYRMGIAIIMDVVKLIKNKKILGAFPFQPLRQKEWMMKDKVLNTIRTLSFKLSNSIFVERNKFIQNHQTLSYFQI